MGQGLAFLNSLLSSFPGEGGGWALCWIFTISLLFTLQDRNNRKRVNSWTLPPGNTLRLQLWHGLTLIKRSRGHIFSTLGAKETLHIHRKVKSGLKVRIMLGHNESCSSQKPSLQGPSWLRGTCTPQGRVPG